MRGSARLSANFLESFAQTSLVASKPTNQHFELLTISQSSYGIYAHVAAIMILILGCRVRVLRWDRSGVATTPAIDYVENWKWFCNVLWRISILAEHAPECLGFDPSARRIRPDDVAWTIMDEAGEEQPTDVDEAERELGDDELVNDNFTWKYVRKLFRESLNRAPLWPRYELSVPDGDAMDGCRKFLVCRPYFRAPGMIGRGTRGYVALD